VSGFSAHPTAVVDLPCTIGEGTRIWHFVHVFSGARIGRDCVIGQGAMVAATAVLGDRVRVQNHVSIYDGVTIEDDVFLGPSCVLTNVKNPRAAISRKGSFVATGIRRGATIGANATIVCGVTLGRHCFVAAGAVVTHDVPDYALVMGTPARPSGWMSRHGQRLRFEEPSGMAVCPESGLRYVLEAGLVRCLDLDENAPLS
jgi:UDP-2-acetamido-3-amino-2,3-dideoxy-glucuronate N-acetyltransferase